MRTSRSNVFAAIILCCGVTPTQAGPFFDCLKNETFTIPPIVTPWGSTQGNIIIHPGTQSAPVQSAPSDVFTSKLLDVLLSNLFSNITKPVTTTPPASDSDSMRRANDTLTKIESKLDRLESLINDRVSKLESDVATVAKAQRESTAQLEQRLVETTDLVKKSTDQIAINADNINLNTKAIFRTQQETAMLLGSQGIGKTGEKQLANDITVTRLDTNGSTTLNRGTQIEEIGRVTDASGTLLSIIRYRDGGQTIVATVKASDL